MKRFVVLLCTLTLMIGALPVYVAGETLFCDEKMNDYEGRMQERFVRILLQRSSFDMDHIYEFSQAYDIYGDDDPNNEAFFLFDENECVGQLTCTFYEGQYVSSFFLGKIDCITELHNNKVPFCLVTSNDSLFAYCEDDIYLVNGVGPNSNDIVTGLNSVDNYAFIETEPITLNYSEVQDYLTLNSQYETLSVPYVANSTTSSGAGLCWAATIISIAAYRNGTSNPISAITLYNALYQQYGGTPSGVALWIKRGYSFFGLTYSYYSYGTTYSVTKSRIQQDKPIFAGLKGTNTSGNTTAHAFVICGYQELGGEYHYIVMDPNFSSGYIYVPLSDPTSSNFTYVTTAGSTLTNWYQRVH